MDGIKIACVAAIVSAALVTPALPRGSVISFKGYWHIDLKRSIYPDAWHVRSVTLHVITDDGKTYESEETQVRADGTVIPDVVHAFVDGKFYPVLGSQVNSTVAITQRVSGLMRLDLVGPGGFHGVETCNISGDLNTLTCDTLVTSSAGKKNFGRSVYVRDQ